MSKPDQDYNDRLEAQWKADNARYSVYRADMTTFKVGDRVRTNRVHGSAGFATVATVVEIRSSDYVIRYDAEGRHSGDFMVVGRSPQNLRPV